MYRIYRQQNTIKGGSYKNKFSNSLWTRNTVLLFPLQWYVGYILDNFKKTDILYKNNFKGSKLIQKKHR